MKVIYLLVFSFLSIQSLIAQAPQLYDNETIVLGAERFDKYVKCFKNKKIALVVNQTTVVGRNYTHLVDTLLKQGVKIAKIFAPEHGFRGDADAGEDVHNMTDTKTGIPIISIYGKKQKPDSNDLKDVDILVFDIQDVGARFYTYISTLQYVLEACAEHKVPMMILDRPNPNGHYVDGPILRPELKSFVGMQPIPVVHGMTIGEYAQMLNTEGMLANKVKAKLTVIKCKNYNHKKLYALPIKPSPNIPNMQAVYLYPSICYFEGTDVSVGRGTDKQFQVYGSPNFSKSKASFSFTPRPNKGATKPFQEGRECYGFDLSTKPIKELQQIARIDLSYLLNYYRDFDNKNIFFLKGNFFDKLAGNYQLRQQLESGKTEAEIRATWQADLKNFIRIRKKYLLYDDFK